jgi:crotonobetainyl-CoA:carnitine CoA-transferase CaiB-like acyl-CoA transferase
MSLLNGIRVVELGMWVAGPAAAGILADWGAEIIKIEMPKGDPMRKLYAALSGSSLESCPPFDLYNRGKKSIALDIHQPEGVALVQRLIATADVFITNTRPQFLERVGLDAASLLAKHPALVYASLTAYGLEGPDRDAPGYDMAAFSGRSGMAERATPAGSAPPTFAGGMGDNVSALTLVAGIMGALFHRERTGQGQLVSTSLLRTGIYTIGMDVSARLALGRVAPVAPRTQPQNPLMNSYRASDGKWFWLVGAESERHWPVMAKALGEPSLMQDERFATPRDRRRNSAALVDAFDRLTAQHTRDEWAVIFREHEVWWAPINSVDDVVVDPQAHAAGAFVHVPGATPAGSEPAGAAARNSVATPIDFSATPVGPAGPPPRVSADANALLRELGMSEAEVRALHDKAVVF